MAIKVNILIAELSRWPRNGSKLLGSGPAAGRAQAPCMLLSALGGQAPVSGCYANRSERLTIAIGMLRASLRALHISAVANARAGGSVAPKAMGKNVYAVVTGRRPGLYTKWEDCLLQVKGFPGNRYKVCRRRFRDCFLEPAVLS